MFRTGILVLTSSLRLIPSRLAPLLGAAAEVVEEVLYVHLHPGLGLGLGGGGVEPGPDHVPASQELFQLLAQLYAKSLSACGRLDVRVVLSNVSSLCPSRQPSPSAQRLSEPPEVVLTDYRPPDTERPGPAARRLEQYVLGRYTCGPGLRSVFLPPVGEAAECPRPGPGEGLPRYGDVVLGGTFDRLHAAHKVLLSASCLLTRRRLLIGVADGELLEAKDLKELIEPYQIRVEKLRTFLLDVNPGVQYEFCPLRDRYGPAVTDPELECIVVSEETRKGGDAVNRKRLANALPELAVHQISLVKDVHHTSDEEEKISSSSLRKRLLGSLLLPPENNPRIPASPYVIGLTGYMGSGKSRVADQLRALGAAAIDADAAGHESYRPGTSAHRRIVQEFGPEILLTDGTIDRKALGRIVFEDQEKLKRLTSIVWPETAVRVKQMIVQAGSEGKSVCVVEAALLLESGWDEMVHEVWVVIVPQEEVVRRIVERDGVSEDDARKRLANQWSNSQRLQHANVVLSTQWEPEFTQRQIQKAWHLLQSRKPSC